MIRLETARLVIRDYKPEDEEEYYLLKSDEGAMLKYQSDIMVHSREESDKEFAGVLEDAGKPDRTFYFLRVELKEDGRQLGSVGYTVEGRTPVGKISPRRVLLLPGVLGEGVRHGGLHGNAALRV